MTSLQNATATTMKRNGGCHRRRGKSRKMTAAPMTILPVISEEGTLSLPFSSLISNARIVSLSPPCRRKARKMSAPYKILHETIEKEIILPLATNGTSAGKRASLLNQLHANLFDFQLHLTEGEEVLANNMFHKDYPFPNLLPLPQDKWAAVCRQVQEVAAAGELPAIIERLEFLNSPSGSRVPPNISTPHRPPNGGNVGHDRGTSSSPVHNSPLSGDEIPNENISPEDKKIDQGAKERFEQQAQEMVRLELTLAGLTIVLRSMRPSADGEDAGWSMPDVVNALTQTVAQGETCLRRNDYCHQQVTAQDGTTAQAVQEESIGNAVGSLSNADNFGGLGQR